MAHITNPIILQSDPDTGFTASDSPFKFNLKPFFGQQNVKGFIVVNDGKGDIIVQTSQTNTNFGDEMLLKEGEVYEIENGSVEAAKLTHVTDSSYRIIAAQADIHLLTGTRKTDGLPFAKRWKEDENDSSILYRGRAVPGSLTSNSVWEVVRWKSISDTDIEKTYANGNADFDKVFDNADTFAYITP